MDRFVEENYSKPSKLPLILVALKEHHPTFINISSNAFLMKEGIKGDYNAFTLEQLREKTWEILEPHYLAKIADYLKRFEQAKANDTGSASLAVISKAISEHRVETLFIDVDKIIPGKVLPESGKIFDRDISNPGIGDVLDELVQLALKSKSEVVVLPSAFMPDHTGIAAIFRF